MELGLVYARSRNGVIGKGGQMPWRLPEDMAHFKAVTLGCTVIMGRKTWDSIPPKFRPLPGRRNIVVTRNPQWQAEGAESSGSLPDAVARCAGEDRVWVIGGGELYAQALPLASRAEVTEIEIDTEGDTFAPVLDADWQEAARERLVSSTGTALSFVTYQRTTNGD